jgi:flagellar FliL protein
MAAKKEPEGKKKPAPPAEAPPGESAPKAESAAPKGKGKLKLIIIVALAMLVGGAGAFAAFKFLGGPKAPEAAAPGGDEFAATITELPEGEPIHAPSKSRPEAAPAEASGGHGSAAPAEGAAAVPAGPITVKLDPFTTNLNEPSGRRFLKVVIGLEVDDQAGADELERKLPDIQDSILILLSSQSIQDISTVDGKERLRSQILNRTNSFMTDHKVRKVKYAEFIIQ